MNLAVTQLSSNCASAGLFIVGAPRTGSTLLRRVLNAHSAYAIPPESYFLLDFLAAETVPSAKRLALLLNDPELQSWSLNNSLALDKTLNLPAAIVELHRRYAQQHKKPRWGQKTPRFVRSWQQLSEWFPGALFIHTVRDPRAVVASLGASPAHRNNVVVAAKRWNEDTKHGLALEAALPERSFRFSYEHFVAAPEFVAKALCRFLNIEFEATMLEPGQALPLNEHEARHGHHQNVSGAVRSDLSEQWRQSLRPQELAWIAAIAGETARACGYHLSQGSQPTPSRQLAASAGAIFMAIKKAAIDLLAGRNFWWRWRRQWRLGVFFSRLRDYFAGR